MSAYKTRIGEDDTPITVHYIACKFRAGSTDGRGGPKLEPDEPAHLEIDYITDKDGHVIELDKEQLKDLELEIGQDLWDQERDYDDERHYRYNC